MRLHVRPHIGKAKMRELGPLQIQHLHSTWREAGLSPTSMYHAHYVLHGMLELAVRWRILATNPCKLVKAPRRRKAEITAWDLDEVGRILATALGTPLESLWTLALCTGMRRGELLGLMWADVDLPRAELSVRRTLSRGKGSHVELGTPKTTASTRSIALPAVAVRSLTHHKQEQEQLRLVAGDAWQDYGFVFSDELGRAIHPNTLQRRFDELIRAAGVRRIRIHDLRHTNATMLLAKDVHPKVVQERLGHSAIGMTLDLYSHTVPHMQRRAADLLDEELGSPPAPDDDDS